jgi:FlaA1/EpsC-like NDP-sugar epimerase
MVTPEAAQIRKPQRPTLPSIDRQIQFALDGVVLLAGFALSYLVRFEFSIPEFLWLPALQQAPLVLLIQLAAAARCGIYSFLWRYIGVSELRPFLQAALFVMMPLVVLRLVLPEALAIWRVPLSIIFLSQVFGFGGMLAVRVLRRLVWESGWTAGRRRTASRATLIVGAGRAGAAIARELRRAKQTRLVGLLDDDPRKRNLAIHGVRVLGDISQLSHVLEKYEVGLVVVAIRQAPRRLMRDLIEACKGHDVALKVVPSFDELLSGGASQSLRSVEIEDLLGREPVELDQQAMGTFLTDRTVLVTGAGGSIGSEICRQVASFAPACLILVERAEFALFEIHRELSRTFPHTATRAIVADISDAARIHNVLFQYRPEVVVHAAAHKHVSLMETNCTEAIKNNVIGTQVFGDCCGRAGVHTFIQVSTDKAVHPTSIMGASKRLAELVVQALDQEHSTKYVAVRFGNVMGSAGSVVPIFRNQIAEGGPVTVTHPNMVRYFMTIPEASQLVLQAGALGQGGEIMVLDMGDPVRILDLAEDMIRLSGFRPYEDIEITFTGARQGEKFFEELESVNEALAPTSHPKIRVGCIQPPQHDLQRDLTHLQELANLGLEGEIRRSLTEILGMGERTAPAPRLSGTRIPARNLASRHKSRGTEQRPMDSTERG